MFGRLVKVSISNEIGSQLILVDPYTQDSLICEADITCMPNKERTSLTLKINNLDSYIRNQIISDEYKYIRVEYGYKDYDGGILSTMFEGTLQRMITQRPSVETSQTIFYAYELGDAYNYGFYSGIFSKGTSLYDVAMKIATEGKIQIPIICSNTLKSYILTEDKSFYGEQMVLLQEIADSIQNITFMHTMGRVYLITTSENLNEEVIVMSGINEKGELVSSSGLVGIPTLMDDGVSFNCLVNPQIRIYSTVLIANTFISDSQEGFERQSSSGAEFDKDGLYVVMKINTHITNGPEESVMRIRAISRTTYIGSN